MNNTPSHHDRLPARFHCTPAGTAQSFLVASCPEPVPVGEAAADAYARIARVLAEEGLQVIHERVFGSLGAKPAVMAARQEALRARGLPPGGPVTYVQGRPPWGEGLAGAILRAVNPRGAAESVWTIEDGGELRGRGWRREQSTAVVLQAIQPSAQQLAEAAAPAEQARAAIEQAQRILQAQGLTYGHVARTWFYLADILEWYGAFNTVRNAKYGELNLVAGDGGQQLRLPASTGIEGRASHAGAVCLDLLAVATRQDAEPAARQLSNPRQADAFGYGSAFSRGAVMGEPGGRLIEVSGTAAIDEQGESRYPGDVRAQIVYTLDNIERLLGQEGAELDDIVAATAFLKRAEDAPAFYELMADRGLRDLPAVCVVGDICRADLLFELDAEAAIDGAI